MPVQVGQVAHWLAMNNATAFTFTDDRGGTGAFRLTWEDRPENDGVVKLVQGMYELEQLEA